MKLEFFVSTHLAGLLKVIPTRVNVNTGVNEAIFGHDYRFVIEIVRPVIDLFVVEKP